MTESNGNIHEFPTGAVRNKDGWGVRYDLFSPIATEALARVFGEGADGPDAYPPWNWEKGLSVSFLVNRALRHWFLYASGDRSEDHLAKAEWGFHCARHSEEAWPHLNLDMRRKVGEQANVPPVVDDETAASWDRLRANLDRMKRDVQEAVSKADDKERSVEYPADGSGPIVHYHPVPLVRDSIPDDPWEGSGAYMDGSGTVRFDGPISDRSTQGAIRGYVAGERLWAGDSVYVGQDGKVRTCKHDPSRDHGSLTPSDRIPRRFHILPVAGFEGRCAQYKVDLEFEGHEVVSRWIEGYDDTSTLVIEESDIELQSCDTAIVLMDGDGGQARIDKARQFGKPIVAIGLQPDDFPRHGHPERWFQDWSSFLRSLVPNKTWSVP